MTWDAETWTAVGAWATVVVGGGAAIAAIWQVRESRHLREAQAQPYIVVALEPDPINMLTINLRVENIGQTLARDVRFSFDPPLRSVMDEKAADGNMLSESPLVTDGVPTMPPGMKIERIFDVATMWDEGGPPVLRYDVEVYFADRNGKPQEPLRYPIDFGPFLSGTFTVRKSTHDGVKALIGIEALLKTWTEGKQGLSVWTRDGNARDTERRRLHAERAAEQEERSRRAAGDA
jgi:hypothetical protein